MPENPEQTTPPPAPQPPAMPKRFFLSETAPAPAPSDTKPPLPPGRAGRTVPPAISPAEISPLPTSPETVKPFFKPEPDTSASTPLSVPVPHATPVTAQHEQQTAPGKPAESVNAVLPVSEPRPAQEQTHAPSQTETTAPAETSAETPAPVLAIAAANEPTAMPVLSTAVPEAAPAAQNTAPAQITVPASLSGIMPSAKPAVITASAAEPANPSPSRPEKEEPAKPYAFSPARTLPEKPVSAAELTARLGLTTKPAPLPAATSDAGVTISRLRPAALTEQDSMSDWRSLARVPRYVPPTLAHKLEFGNFRALLGLLLLLAGSLGGFMTLPVTDFSAFRFKKDSVLPGKGVVYMTENSGVRYQGAQIDKIFYVSSVSPAAPLVPGVCYVPRLVLSKNDVVDTEHLKASPAITRIRGTRLKPLPAAALFGLPLPLLALGLLFSALGISAGFRLVRLLRTGELTEGSVVKATPFLLSARKHHLYRVALKFKTADGQEQFLKSWARTKGPLAKHSVLPVLYSPRNPRFAAVPGPRGITVKEDGTLRASLFGPLYFLLALASALAVLLPLLYWLKNGFTSPFGAI